jgi:hypothetical protein
MKKRIKNLAAGLITLIVSGYLLTVILLVINY